MDDVQLPRPAPSPSSFPGFSGSFAGTLYDTIRTGRPSSQFFSFVASRPISGASTISGLPSPSVSKQRTRWTVGSSHGIACIVHSSSRVLPRLSHCSVPGFFVSNGFHPAPTTSSGSLSPSMSIAATQTLSGFVRPSRMTRFFHVGFWYQTTLCWSTTTMSGLPSPSMSAVMTA